MDKSSSVGCICIVANELNHLFRNGGIGTHNWLLAEALNDVGWNVHILYSSDVENPAQLSRCRELCDARGITLWHLDEFVRRPEDDVECGLGGSADKLSMHVRRAIEQLDAVLHFDLIEFAEWSGYAFRTVQARAMGTALQNARIIVKLHASNQWCREANRVWLSGADDLIRDYFERYSFEHADFQLSPSSYMLSYARSIGWKVREDARVVRYHYPASATELPVPHGGRPEVVFFGRLEVRKGLKLFLDVAKSLPVDVPVAFLGKETAIDGIPASRLISETLASRPYTLRTDFDRQQALDYLTAENRVAVVPSLVENYPFTVLECATGGIPFLASNVGGIPEIVSERDLQHTLLFEPTSRALRKKIDEYLATAPAERRRYVDRMHEICSSVRNRAEVCRDYASLLSTLPSRQVEPIASNRTKPAAALSPPASIAEQPLVSIVVPYYNLGQFVRETLRSLVAQDYPRIEVICVNDGSTDPYSLEVWSQLQVEHPDFRFVTQENQGLGGARNTGLAMAEGEFYLPIDADNIARPDMVSRFVETMRRNPDMTVATCHHLAFETGADIANGKFIYAYRPFGGPFVVAALRNVYGDANAMFRTAALRASGGYSTDRELGYEDWELFVKLARQGHRIDVVPEYLFYYRHRPSSMLRTTDAYLNRRRVLREFFAAADLPRAEQIELWMALAGFDETLRPPPPSHIQPQLPHTSPHVKQRAGLRLAAYRFKTTMKKIHYYNKLTDAFKQFRHRAAA